MDNLKSVVDIESQITKNQDKIKILEESNILGCNQSEISALKIQIKSLEWTLGKRKHLL